MTTASSAILALVTTLLLAASDALGTGAALLPLLLPLRPTYYPLTHVLLITTLVWDTHRLVSRPPAARSR